MAWLKNCEEASAAEAEWEKRKVLPSRSSALWESVSILRSCLASTDDKSTALYTTSSTFSLLHSVIGRRKKKDASVSFPAVSPRLPLAVSMPPVREFCAMFMTYRYLHTFSICSQIQGVHYNFSSLSSWDWFPSHFTRVKRFLPYSFSYVQLVSGRRIEYKCVHSTISKCNYFPYLLFSVGICISLDE